MRRVRTFVYASPATYEHWHALGYRTFCTIQGHHGAHSWIMELNRG